MNVPGMLTAKKGGNRSALLVLHPAMKVIGLIRFLVAGLVCIGVGGVSVLKANAAEGGNPYSAVVAQNVFRLRPEVRADVLAPRQSTPVVIPPSIRVAGFTDVCGRSQVLLEISEQGKEVVRRVLSVGEQFLGIETEEINVVSMRARLRINGESTEVTLSSGGVLPTAPSGLKLPRK